jgi:hypothetical protein
MYVYKTTNLINGKTYIGQCSKQINKSTKYLGSGKYIQLAIKKYGTNSFEKTILIEVNTREELNFYEKFYISTMMPEYNIALGGWGGNYDDETRSKISTSVKLLWTDPDSVYNSKEYRQLLSESHKGRPVSEETKELIRNSLATSEKFRKYCETPKSEELKKRVSESVILAFSTNKNNCYDNLIAAVRSEEHRKKLSDIHKLRYINGTVPWNKGRTGVYTEEQLQKYRKPKTINPETEKLRVAKLSKALKGRKLSETHKKQISNTKKNKSKDDLERLAKISSDRMKKRHAEGTGGNYKQIKCIESGKIYESVKSYQLTHNISEYFVCKLVKQGKLIKFKK